MKIPFHNSLSAICSWVTKSEFLTLMPLKGYNLPNNYHINLKENLLKMTTLRVFLQNLLVSVLKKRALWLNYKANEYLVLTVATSDVLRLISTPRQNFLFVLRVWQEK